MARIIRSFAAALAITAAILAAPAARAQQGIVFDASNFAQNVLQAERSLQQIHNQMTSLQNEARMLEASPLQLSPELSQSIREAQALYRTAEGLSYQIDQLTTDLKTTYPEVWSAYRLSDVAARTRTWLEQDRRAIEFAMRAEARAVAMIGRTSARVDAALLASAAAQGPTGVGQATNQLLGINIAQISEIQTLLIAQARAANALRMEQVAREARSIEIQRRAFPAARGTPTSPASRRAF